MKSLCFYAGTSYKISESHYLFIENIWIMKSAIKEWKISIKIHRNDWMVNKNMQQFIIPLNDLMQFTFKYPGSNQNTCFIIQKDMKHTFLQ